MTNTLVIQMLTGLSSEEIVYISFYNKVRNQNVYHLCPYHMLIILLLWLSLLLRAIADAMCFIIPSHPLLKGRTISVVKIILFFSRPKDDRFFISRIFFK